MHAALLWARHFYKCPFPDWERFQFNEFYRSGSGMRYLDREYKFDEASPNGQGKSVMSHSLRMKVALGLIALAVFAADGAVIYHGLVRFKGTNLDFYMMWFGTRELWHGHNPYTDQTTRQIQIGILGRPAVAGEIEYRFVYPAYFAILLFPLPLLPFTWAVTIWLVLLQFALMLALAFTLRMLDWHPKIFVTLLLCLAWFLFRYNLIALALAQTTPMTLMLLTAAGLACSRGRLEWAAIALALATFKPQLAVFPILGWLALMVVGRQWRAVSFFFLGLAALCALPFIFLPTWFLGFLSQIKLYAGYSNPQSPLTLIISALPDNVRYLGLITGVVLGVGYLLWIVWRQRTLSAKGGFTWVLVLTILLTLLIFPLAFVYEIALALVPGLILWRVLVLHNNWISRALLVLLACVPVLSWGTIIGLPTIFDRLGLPYNVVNTDKILIPVLLLIIFIYVERRSMTTLPDGVPQFARKVA